MIVKDFHHCILKVSRQGVIIGAAFVIDLQQKLVVALLPSTDLKSVQFFAYNHNRGYFSTTVGCVLIDEVDLASGLHLFQITSIPSNITLQSLDLLEPQHSRDHVFSSFGILPRSQQKSGQLGSGIVADVSLIDGNNIPILQLNNSNTISSAFMGSPVYDEIDRGVIGIIYDGSVNTKEQRQTEVSFAIRIDYIVQQFPDYLQHLLKKPKRILPEGFVYLSRYLSKKSLTTQYQDFLLPQHLTYYSRAEFEYKKLSRKQEDFLTEPQILEALNQTSVLGGILIGPNGIGRTRLMLEVGRLAEQQGWTTILVETTVTSFKTLLPHLKHKEKYLLLFDNLEEQHLFGNSLVDNLQRQGFEMPIKLLANCLPSFKSNAKFPNSSYFIKFDLGVKDSINSGYHNWVIQQITKDLHLFPYKKHRRFFKEKVAFAVFFRFLKQKNQLTSTQIQNSGDFKDWLKSRLSPSLNLASNDIASLSPKILYFLVLLPLKTDVVQSLYQDSQLEHTLNKLQAEGWITGNQQQLDSAHPIIGDNLLMLYLAPVTRKDSFRNKMQQFLNYAVKFEAIENWIQTLKRLADQQQFQKQKEAFYTIINNTLKETPTVLEPIKDEVLNLVLIDVDHRQLLIQRYWEFFLPAITKLSFGYPLSFTLYYYNKKGTANKSPKRKKELQTLFTTWVASNENFIEVSDLAARILSAYANYFGFNQYAEQSILDHLVRFPNHQDNYRVLIAWLTQRKGISQFIEAACYDYLEKYAATDAAGFILSAWFQHQKNWLKQKRNKSKFFQGCLSFLKQHQHDSNIGPILTGWIKYSTDISPIEDMLHHFMQHHYEQVSASYLLAAWLDKLNRQAIYLENYTTNFLSKYATKTYAVFVLSKWLYNTKKILPIKSFCLRYLKVNAAEIHTAYLLDAWLYAGGYFVPISSSSIKFLSSNAKQVPHYLLKPYNNILKACLHSKDHCARIHATALNFFKQYAQHFSTGYTLKSWIETTKDLNAVTAACNTFLNTHIHQVNYTRPLLEALLKHSSDFTPLQALSLQFFKTHTEKVSIGTTFRTWIERKGDQAVIHPYLKAYLEANMEKKQVKSLLTTYLQHGKDVAFINPYLQVYLRHHGIIKSNHTLFSAWLKRSNDTSSIATAFHSYLNYNVKHSPNNKILESLFTAWLGQDGALSTIKPMIEYYLRQNLPRNIGFKLLIVWLKKGGAVEPLEEAILQWYRLEKSSENKRKTLKQTLKELEWDISFLDD